MAPKYEEICYHCYGTGYSKSTVSYHGKKVDVREICHYCGGTGYIWRYVEDERKRDHRSSKDF
jgi:DnaJ-class molecular chaperone